MLVQGVNLRWPTAAPTGSTVVNADLIALVQGRPDVIGSGGATSLNLIVEDTLVMAEKKAVQGPVADARSTNRVVHPSAFDAMDGIRLVRRRVTRRLLDLDRRGRSTPRSSSTARPLPTCSFSTVVEAEPSMACRYSGPLATARPSTPSRSNGSVPRDRRRLENGQKRTALDALW